MKKKKERKYKGGTKAVVLSWRICFYGQLFLIHTLVRSLALRCRLHWHHAIIGCVQCISWVTTHFLQLLSCSGISLECLWAPVLSAHLSRDLSGSFTPHYPHGIHLVPRKTHMLVSLNWSIAHFHFYRGSVALLYYCRQHPPGLRAPSSHLPRGTGYEILQETSIQPGDRISASLIAESPKVWGVVVSSCSELIEREGKGRKGILPRILFEEVCSAMQVLLMHRWWGDRWMGWPCVASDEVLWRELLTYCL